MPGFALLERRYAETYTLLRYRAWQSAATVSPARLAKVAATVVGPAAVLVQERP